jgi:hypothetical protein
VEDAVEAGAVGVGGIERAWTVEAVDEADPVGELTIGESGMPVDFKARKLDFRTFSSANGKSSSSLSSSSLSADES